MKMKNVDSTYKVVMISGNGQKRYMSMPWQDLGVAPRMA